MVVRDVFRLGGERGTVVAGRIEEGHARIGDDVEVVIDGLATRTLILEVEVRREAVEQASAGDEAAIRLQDVVDVFPFPGTVVRGATPGA
jgi:translation elongation factor EF-Tu-like GTPase